ncbi:ssl1498 family light-harvesting-like protein [Microcoleus sp. N9_B2]|uniref:photosystem II assembly protein Psb34 n=1 Tax=unclassified Microcoleus TaxID=2642155 RepID=UPI002FD75ADB
MPYIKDDDGRLNNFAKEPKVYGAEYPNKNQQRNYIIGGIVAALLVAGLVYVATLA